MLAYPQRMSDSHAGDRRATFDFEISFLNGGGLKGEGFRLDIPGEDATERELADALVRDLRLLMVRDVRILNKRIIFERHKRAAVPEAGAPEAPAGRFIDLSHAIDDGMVTYPGIPAPHICDYLSREASRSRYAPGVARRVRSAECFLASRYPDIQVVSRVSGTYDTSRSEDLTNGIVQAHPELKAVLSFTAASTRGVHAALHSRQVHRTISLVGCEQDSDLIGYLGKGEIAAIVAENTYRMGYEAVGLIVDSLAGKPLPARSVVPPLLIAKQNLNYAEALLFTSFPR